MAKAWLKKNDLAYSEVDVTADQSKLAFLKEQGHRTVPQIYLGDQVLVSGGYDGLKNQDPQILRERIEKTL